MDEGRSGEEEFESEEGEELAMKEEEQANEEEEFKSVEEEEQANEEEEFKSEEEEEQANKGEEKPSSDGPKVRTPKAARVQPVPESTQVSLFRRKDQLRTEDRVLLFGVSL
ncbi:hypothetical protein C0J45_22368 [Silurus meridionalis]|nr:hypothetical protein C0J45_22368 [Silurus meridionalis]